MGMRSRIGIVWFTCALLMVCFAPARGAEIPRVGPANGTLVVVGGGAGKDVMKKFVELAGGPSALIVAIPTASEGDFDQSWRGLGLLRAAGATNLIVLHTRDKKQADTEAFIAPLKRARAVWFGGGRQWRLVDSYLGTKTQQALFDLLDRGGVIGGSSAGATIQGSYLVRGAREGNTIMMAPGYEEGFGFLRHVAVDQHIIARKRENDLAPVVKRHPELLGIGIDEDTAIVVQGDSFEVVGKSKVAIHDPKRPPGADGKVYYFLQPGDHYDLARREVVP